MDCSHAYRNMICRPMSSHHFTLHYTARPGLGAKSTRCVALSKSHFGVFCRYALANMYKALQVMANVSSFRTLLAVFKYPAVLLSFHRSSLALILVSQSRLQTMNKSLVHDTVVPVMPHRCSGDIFCLVQYR
jgi:hypothetical protein